MSDPATDLTQALWGIAKEAIDAPEKDAQRLAEKGLRKLGATELRRLAVGYVIGMIEAHRRVAAREVEDRARREAATQKAVAKTATPPTQTRPSAFDDPSIYDTCRALSESGVPTVFLRSKERRDFIRRLGDRHAEWYARGIALAEAAYKAGLYKDDGLSHPHMFASDFYPGGERAYYAEQRFRAVVDLVERESQRVRLEVTRELLETRFALGDGTRTTWGTATVSQHEQRIVMLTKQAAGTVETAASHRAAIEMIQAAGASTLAEIAETERRAA